MKKINEYTIAETYSLPSKGMVYDKKVNPVVTIRSMTTEDEMKRLVLSDTPYKVMSDLLESCLVEDIGISVYDMCIGDYEYLMHKLRVVTYGPEYKILEQCPICKKTFEVSIDLDSLDVKEYDDSFIEAKTITLPMSGKVVELNYQTPRMIDNVQRRKREIQKMHPEITTDPGIIITLANAISTVDGQVLRDDQKEAIVRKLPMKDANYLLQSAIKLNEMVGLNTDFNTNCKHCGSEINTSFRITPEFWSPSI